MTTLTLNWQPANLQNDIVKLLPLTAGDFEKLYALACDPLIWEQHPTKDRYKKEVFQLYFEEAIGSKTAFLIADNKGEIIGCTRYYDYNAASSSIAIGYTFLARQYWGGLHNQAAKSLLLGYAFNLVERVYFHIGAANIRSQLATTRLGAVKVNEVAFGNNGQSPMHYEYVITKEQWAK